MADQPQLDIWDETGTLLGADSYQQKQHNWAVLRNYGKNLSSYMEDEVNEWDKRFNAQMAKTTQVDEVKDAHVASTGKTYDNLKDRLDDAGYWSDAGEISLDYILQITDLNSKSSGFKLASETKSSMTTDIMDYPVSQTKINKLTISRA